MALCIWCLCANVFTDKTIKTKRNQKLSSNPKRNLHSLTHSLSHSLVHPTVNRGTERINKTIKEEEYDKDNNDDKHSYKSV